MIGQNIRALRKTRGLTLEGVASKLGKEYTHLSVIENGRSTPRDETILDILVIGLDLPYSKAKDLIAQWRIEEDLSRASNPSAVINSIIASNNSIVINGSNNGVIIKK